MDVEILIHVYVDSGHLSLKTTPTQSMGTLSISESSESC